MTPKSLAYLLMPLFRCLSFNASAQIFLPGSGPDTTGSGTGTIVSLGRMRNNSKTFLDFGGGNTLSIFILKSIIMFFLSYQQRPGTQALKLRMGYNF